MLYTSGLYEGSPPKEGSTMTDFGQIKNYADYIKEDPFRRGLHFPAIEEVLVLNPSFVLFIARKEA
jgi:hypothetical protein